MMKKVSLFFVAMGMMLSATVAQVSVWDGTHTVWTNGSGTETDPYLLENAQHLAHLAYYVNSGTEAVDYVVGSGKYWKLTTNIDLNSLSWTPIGYYNSETDQFIFGGHFDGGGHTIANLKVSGVQFAGLFGQMSGGSVKNVGIVGNSSVSAIKFSSSNVWPCAGEIVGFFDGGTITNCYNTGDVSSSSSSSSSSGGIVGYAVDITITNCYNTGDISSSVNSNGNSSAVSGGIAGSAIINVTIINCYNIGDVSASGTGDTRAGGIVGSAYNTTITNCYNTGDVFASSSKSYSYSGGIVGYADDTIITNCYNIGDVSASSAYAQAQTSAGGIVGYAFYVTITNCYNIGSVAASVTSSDSGYTVSVSSGGIAGNAKDITIINCYNTGNVSTYAYASGVGYTRAGGIVGYAYGTTITNCYNTGDISISSTSPYSSAISGGIIGDDLGGCTTTNCYNTGDVFASASASVFAYVYAGGIVGRTNSAIITNCYNIGDVSAESTGEASVGGIVGDGSAVVNNSYYLDTSAPNPGGGTSQTAEFMKTQEFVNLLNSGPEPNNAYKLDNLLINNGYPLLMWQMDGDIATLLNLIVSEGVLTPAFSSDVFNYTVSVPSSVTSITITAFATDPNATIDGVGEKQLAMGANPFTITVTAADGKTKLDYTVTVTRADVGIVENGLSNIKVYPNPTRGQLRITNYELRIENVDVFDVMGRNVLSRQFSIFDVQLSIQIDISHLQNGIYFVRIQTENGMITKKVIKN